MTLIEAVMSVVKEMVEEAEGADREQFSDVSAALHRYARQLKNVLRQSEQGILLYLEHGVASGVHDIPDKQVVTKDDVGLLSDALDMER